MKHSETENRENKAGTALLASGLACFIFGIVTILAEMSISFKEILQWNNSVGPLSGKVGIAIIFWILSWLGLHHYFARKKGIGRKLYLLSLILIGLSFLFTFPPFFKLFS